MFCFGNAAPYIDGQVIDDSREDYWAAVKLGDIRCGQKAIYFYRDGALYYLPYICINEASALVLNEPERRISLRGSSISRPERKRMWPIS